jgi:molybdate transport system regulatory protein
MASPRSRVAARRLQARVKVWLEADGRYVFGLGMSEILKAVEAAGSIKEAAARLGKSYRYVWGRIKKAEASVGSSLVETRVGGKGSDRSGLTRLARQLVRDYDALRERMFAVAAEEFAHLFRPRSRVSRG